MRFVAIGDSIGKEFSLVGASINATDGAALAVDGSHTDKVLGFVQHAVASGDVSGNTIILSCGASNDAAGNGQLNDANVKAQLKTLLDGGAAHIYLLGVGVGPNNLYTNKGVNDQLDKIVKEINDPRVVPHGALDPKMLAYNSQPWDNGVHLTPKGVDAVADQILAKLKPGAQPAAVAKADDPAKSDASKPDTAAKPAEPVVAKVDPKPGETPAAQAAAQVPIVASGADAPVPAHDAAPTGAHTFHHRPRHRMHHDGGESHHHHHNHHHNHHHKQHHHGHHWQAHHHAHHHLKGEGMAEAGASEQVTMAPTGFRSGRGGNFVVTQNL